MFTKSFLGWLNLRLGATLLQIFNFPAKISMSQFLFFNFLCQPLLKIFIFPPKNLEKMRAPKIRMRRFFLIIFNLLYVVIQ